MRHKHGLSNNRVYRMDVDKNGVSCESRSEKELAGRRKKYASDKGDGRTEPGSLHGTTGKIHPRAKGTAVRPNKDTYR